MTEQEVRIRHEAKRFTSCLSVVTVGKLIEAMHLAAHAWGGNCPGIVRVELGHLWGELEEALAASQEECNGQQEETEACTCE